MKNIKSTLIISTYNFHEALELTLLSILKQSVLPNEIIIADDGSKKETQNLINKFQKTFPIPLIHKWHRDDGFRKTRILNIAIVSASSEYIIQIDGDMILHRHFIKNHLTMAKKNTFLMGSRVWLNKSVSEASQKTKTITFNFLSSGIKNRLNTIHFPLLMKSFTIYRADIKKIRGCNMSFWKSDLLAINGFNEDMTGWGREDSEISARLINLGKLKGHIKFGAVQYHQYHQLNTRSELNINDKILEETILKKKTWCNNGLDKH